jgi:hypothetical protein
MQLTSPVALRGLRVVRSIVEAPRQMTQAAPHADETVFGANAPSFGDPSTDLPHVWPLAQIVQMSVDQTTQDRLNFELLFDLNFEDLANMQLPANIDYLDSAWTNIPQ